MNGYFEYLMQISLWTALITWNLAQIFMAVPLTPAVELILLGLLLAPFAVFAVGTALAAVYAVAGFVAQAVAFVVELVYDVFNVDSQPVPIEGLVDEMHYEVQFQRGVLALSDEQRLQLAIDESLAVQQPKHHAPVLQMNPVRRPPINPEYVKRERHWDKHDFESYLKCPHGGKIMVEPVITRDGVTYDKQQAQDILKDKPHMPNYAMNSLIKAYNSAQRVNEQDRPAQLDRKHFEDPITLEPMKDPVVVMDGHTYERAEIMTWLEKSTLSPSTGKKDAITCKTAYVNHVLKAITRDFGYDKPEPVVQALAL